MPILDLEAPARGPLQTDIGPWDRLLAVMAYPGDAEAREELLAVGQLQARAEQQRVRKLEGASEPFLQRVLARSERVFWRELDGGAAAAARPAESVFHAYQERCRFGQGAGEIFLHALRPAFSAGGAMREPTLGQGRRLVAAWWQRAGLPASEATVKQRAWQPFRSVAHLWAAWRLLAAHGSSEPVIGFWRGDPQFDRALARGEPLRASLGRFLAVSEGLLAARPDMLDEDPWTTSEAVRQRLPAVNLVLPSLRPADRRILASRA